jgi:hypothetical protein
VADAELFGDLFGRQEWAAGGDFAALDLGA